MLLSPLRHRDTEKRVFIFKPLCLRVSVVIRVLGFFHSFLRRGPGVSTFELRGLIPSEELPRV